MCHRKEPALPGAASRSPSTRDDQAAVDAPAVSVRPTEGQRPRRRGPAPAADGDATHSFLDPATSQGTAPSAAPPTPAGPVLRKDRTTRGGSVPRGPAMPKRSLPTLTSPPCARSSGRFPAGPKLRRRHSPSAPCRPGAVPGPDGSSPVVLRKDTPDCHGHFDRSPVVTPPAPGARVRSPPARPRSSRSASCWAPATPRSCRAAAAGDPVAVSFRRTEPHPQPSRPTRRAATPLPRGRRQKDARPGSAPAVLPKDGPRPACRLREPPKQASRPSGRTKGRTVCRPWCHPDDAP